MQKLKKTLQGEGYPDPSAFCSKGVEPFILKSAYELKGPLNTENHLIINHVYGYVPA